MEENVFYQDQDVLVTGSRFVTGDKTYAMRNISSVQMGTISANTSGHLIFIIICVVVLIAGGIPFKIGAVIVGAIMFWDLKRQKPSFTVRLNSNSGESNVLTSKNKDYIQEIIGAVNSAIISG